MSKFKRDCIFSVNDRVKVRLGEFEGTEGVVTNIDLTSCYPIEVLLRNNEKVPFALNEVELYD